MNKIILEQLKKVTVTKLEYSENDTSIFIPKTIKILKIAHVWSNKLKIISKS